MMFLEHGSLLHLMQVVRYHSLVIDHNSLPNHLLPIAWTSSLDKPSLLEVENRDDIYHIPYKRNKSNIPQLLDDLNVETVTQMFSNRTRVLMGIRHSNRPHYGVQVCYNWTIFFYFLKSTLF